MRVNTVYVLYFAVDLVSRISYALPRPHLEIENIQLPLSLLLQLYLISEFVKY